MPDLQDPDIVVIGSGPNGLVAACKLARAGLRVVVLEAHPRRPGGALGTESLTLPGFLHDTGPGFFPFGPLSPAFRELDLEGRGIRWLHCSFDSCHPASDGTYACISRDLELSAAHFGNARDGERWRKLCSWHRSIETPLLEGMLKPFPTILPWLKLGIVDLVRALRIFASSGRGFSQRCFETEAARRVLPGAALHVDIGPDDPFGAAVGYLLGMTASTGGYGVPMGGGQALTNALLSDFEMHGGRLRLGSRVKRVLIADGRAVGVKTDNEEIRVRQGILADTSAPSLLLDLVGAEHLPARISRKMRKFLWGWPTFKLDYALSGPVPWQVDAARQSAVVHVGDSLDELAQFAAQLRAGDMPDNPYLVVGQQSLADPSRAPRNQHTLYVYTHAPHGVSWDEETKQRLADRVERRLDGLAPGFRAKILQRAITAPTDLERMDENLTHGDLGGGTAGWRQQLLFRPVFPYFRYRMPVQRLYLCSSFAHPGGGVHGMCGDNAARIALEDIA